MSGGEPPGVHQLQQQLALARKEISNLRQQLTSLNHVHRKECDLIYRKLADFRCIGCANKNEGGASALPDKPDFESNYIGTIRTHFPEKRGTPRQPAICPDLSAKLVLNDVFTNPNHSLEGLQEFSHMWILFHFHRNDSTHIRAKVAPPRLNGLRTGVFATRSPNRPSPIGLSLVKIDRIMDKTIYFSGVDMVDQTPVLDIKPYIPQYDNPRSDTFSPEDIPVEDTSLNEAVSGLGVRQLDGEENGRRNPIEATRPMEESFFNRSASRMGEREAPDGEEEESAVAQQPVVRVPAWIDEAVVPQLTVQFKDRALQQLSQLGSECEEKKKAITNVLKEDPRSVYLRQRCGAHCYVFRIAELHVSCHFNDANETVTVYKVFQNEVLSDDEQLN